MPRYDVFISHNSEDVEFATALSRRLQDDAGIRPFLDRWELVPGEPAQATLEKALADSAATAVLLGPSGTGPWEEVEMRNALRAAIKERKHRVIPVLLPGADVASMTGFLGEFVHVDYRKGLANLEAFGRLCAGIRGEAPGRLDSSELLPEDTFFTSESIFDLTRRHLSASGLDVAPYRSTADVSIRDLIKRCVVAYPQKAPKTITHEVHQARGRAFSQKYSERPESEDERFIDYERWLGEMRDFLGLFDASQEATAKVISVGLGNGLEGRGLYEKLSMLIGVDVSASALSAAHERFPAMRTIEASAEFLEGVETGWADVYVSLRTYQSRLLDRDNALYEAYRVLRVGAWALISIPYVYFAKGRELHGLKRQGSSELDPDLPFELADRVRHTLTRLSFGHVGVRTGRFEIYVYGQRR